MYHHVITHIDTTVGHAVRVGGVVGVLEKYQIAWAGVGRGYRGTDVAQPLRPQPPHVPAGVIYHPADKAGTVKGRAGAAAAPDDERIIPKK